MTNWLRYWFTGWERDDFDTKPTDFLETKQKQSLSIYSEFFEAAHRALKPDGVVVMHLGKSPKCDMASELSLIAKERFEVKDIFAEGVEHCESHGVRDKGTTSDHTYLILTPKF